MFYRNWVFEGTFKLSVKEGNCLYQASSRRVAYVLQQSLKEELDRLQKQQIIVPLDVDETSEFCNSFSLIGESIRSAHDSAISCSNSAIIMLFCFAFELLSLLPVLSWLISFSFVG